MSINKLKYHRNFENHCINCYKFERLVLLNDTPYCNEHKEILEDYKPCELFNIEEKK